MNTEAVHANSPLASAVYEGTVRHRRLVPHPHAFDYRMAQLYLDLDEVDQVFGHRWLWSRGARNVAQFAPQGLPRPTTSRWPRPCASVSRSAPARARAGRSAC